MLDYVRGKARDVGSCLLRPGFQLRSLVHQVAKKLK